MPDAAGINTDISRETWGHSAADLAVMDAELTEALADAEGNHNTRLVEHLKARRAELAIAREASIPPTRHPPD